MSAPIPVTVDYASLLEPALQLPFDEWAVEHEAAVQVEPEFWPGFMGRQTPPAAEPSLWDLQDEPSEAEAWLSRFEELDRPQQDLVLEELAEAFDWPNPRDTGEEVPDED